MAVISVILPSIRLTHMPTVLKPLEHADEILLWYGSGEVVAKSNKLVALSTADVFLCINDRTVLADNWRQTLDLALVIHPDVEIFSFTETSCSQFAMRRSFLRHYDGNFFYPGYTHYHADQEIGELARKHRVYKELPEMIESIYAKSDVAPDTTYDDALYRLREGLVL